jgi:hypothetical protein
MVEEFAEMDHKVDWGRYKDLRIGVASWNADFEAFGRWSP